MKDILAGVPGRATFMLLAVALAGPPMLVVLSNRLFGTSPRFAVEVISQLVYCGLAALVVWGVVHWEHRPIRSIGLRRPDWSTLVTAVLLILVGWYVVLPVVRASFGTIGVAGTEAGLQRLAALPLWFRMVVAVTGGAIEETLYRGFAIERLTQITGRRWMGGALALVAFAVSHVPAWGVGFALTADLAIGSVLTLFYLWKRDLIANMVAHGTALVIGMRAVGP